MRRVWLVVSIIMLLSAGFMSSLGTRAQDATPAAAGPVGVTAELLGSGETSSAPGHELSLRRITIAPGGGIPAHTHPGALVIYLESGTWGYIALDEGTQLTRAAVDGTPGPAEEMAVGEEIILNAGDWIYVEDPADDIRNAGEEPVVLWVAGLTRAGEPFTTIMTDMEGMEMGATPTP
jgi:quercetin dioxygenase-like cupin family protein